MAIYLKYDGIQGSVTTKGFENQIELLSASFNGGRTMGMSNRSDKNRGHAEPHISEINCSKAWDATSSVKLLEDSMAGVGGKKALFTYTTTDKNVVVAYKTVELEDAVLSNYSVSAGSTSQPSESFSMNYTKITVTPYEVKDGKATKKDVFTYSLPTMQANS